MRAVAGAGERVLVGLARFHQPAAIEDLRGITGLGPGDFGRRQVGVRLNEALSDPARDFRHVGRVGIALKLRCEGGAAVRMRGADEDFFGGHPRCLAGDGPGLLANFPRNQAGVDDAQNDFGLAVI